MGRPVVQADPRTRAPRRASAADLAAHLPRLRPAEARASSSVHEPLDPARRRTRRSRPLAGPVGGHHGDSRSATLSSGPPRREPGALRARRAVGRLVELATSRTSRNGREHHALLLERLRESGGMEPGVVPPISAWWPRGLRRRSSGRCGARHLRTKTGVTTSDVGEVRAALEGIVGDRPCRRQSEVRRSETASRASRSRPWHPGEPGCGERWRPDHPIRVEDRARVVETVLDVRRYRGVSEHGTHLLRDGHEAIAEDLEANRVRDRGVVDSAVRRRSGSLCGMRVAPRPDRRRLVANRPAPPARRARTLEARVEDDGSAAPPG